MKVILCGYHWTGCKALEILLGQEHEVFVYTHKAEKMAVDLEGMCIKKNIPYTFNKILIENMPFKPDIICSIYYRYIIGKDVIGAVDGRIFNLHPSLLPQYRGCSSLTWAMINGEHYCGYTFHYVDSGCDTGNIIIQKKVPIEDFDTQLTLYNRIMFEAMNDFEKAFKLVKDGYLGEPQKGEASYHKRGCPYNGILSNEMDDTTKERFIRAMIYPPYPMAEYKGIYIDTWRTYMELKNGVS